VPEQSGRKSPPDKKRDVKGLVLGGTVCGFLLAVSASLQQLGLENGVSAVYSYTALEGQTEAVDSILKLASRPYDPKAEANLMSQADFEAALAKCKGSYKLTKGVTLKSDLTLEGVDLATEGVVTISKVLEYANEYLEGIQLNPEWKLMNDGAARIAHALFDYATDVHFFVGCAINPAHQNPNLPIAFGAKFQLIDQLSKCLEKMGKKVSVRFY